MNQAATLSSTVPRYRKHAIAIAIAWSFLAVLPSCGIPELRAPTPAPPLPPDDKPAATAENSAQVPVEEFFGDPVLRELIYEALAGNQHLRILNEDVQIAGNEVLSRTGAYLPLVGLTANAGLDKVSSFTLEGAGIRDDPYRPGQFLSNPHGNYLLGANITWQIDVWRQLRNARDASALQYFSTGEGRNYLVTRLVAEIAENYYTLVALDRRLENLNFIIALLEQSLGVAEAKMEAAQGTLLAVQRFRAEVQKNQSERLIVRQDIIQVENRINYLCGRFPRPVERQSGNFNEFIDLNLHTLSVGVPSQLLLYRPDVRRAERELEAAGLDVKVVRAEFLPAVGINAGVGYQSWNAANLLVTPEALIGNVAGGLVAPFVNRRAIKARYMSANARQLQAVYEYQRTVINAFTEVVNRVSKMENYRTSIEIKKQQVQSLEAAVDSATKLFQQAQADYVDVLFAQRDLFDARRDLIEIKREQLSAVINAYQALGGGNMLPIPQWKPPCPQFGNFDQFHDMYNPNTNELKKAVLGDGW
jgi:NodT family efflux transporter outer membrane factor (OMF) lipoprotein